MSKLSQRQIVAEIRPAEIDVGGTSGSRQAPRFRGRWAQVSGGEITATGEKVYDGGEMYPETLCAPPEIGDVTVTRAFDPDRDGRPLQNARHVVGSALYDISIYTLNCELKEPGTERVYANARLVGITEPEGDASSGAPATFSLTFSVNTVAAG